MNTAKNLPLAEALEYARTQPELIPVPLTDDALYLFCLSSAAARGLHRLKGFATDCLEYFQHRGLFAVISRVPAREWSGAEADPRLRNSSWTSSRLDRHAEVLAHLMRMSPIFPLHFGALFRSEALLISFIERHYKSIAYFLQYIGEKEEWTLKASLDLRACEEHLLHSGLHAARLPAVDPALANVDAQLRAAVSHQVHAWTKLKEQTILELLKPCIIMRHSRPVASIGCPRPELIWNWAVLIRREHRGVLQERLCAFNAANAGSGLWVEATGPCVPYSFCPPTEIHQNTLR